MVFICANMRAVYGIIPFIGFFLFFFSGLTVKAQTLPSWAAPWMPSVSIIRWTMQGLTINEFQNSALFPTVGDFDGYTYILSLFGWGGKSKWYCLNVIFLNAAVFRTLTFISIFVRTRLQQGKRHLIHESVQDEPLL